MRTHARALPRIPVLRYGACPRRLQAAVPTRMHAALACAPAWASRVVLFPL